MNSTRKGCTSRDHHYLCSQVDDCRHYTGMFWEDIVERCQICRIGEHCSYCCGCEGEIFRKLDGDTGLLHKLLLRMCDEDEDLQLLQEIYEGSEQWESFVDGYYEHGRFSKYLWGLSENDFLSYYWCDIMDFIEERNKQHHKITLAHFVNQDSESANYLGEMDMDDSSQHEEPTPPPPPPPPQQQPVSRNTEDEHDVEKLAEYHDEILDHEEFVFL